MGQVHHCPRRPGKATLEKAERTVAWEGELEWELLLPEAASQGRRAENMYLQLTLLPPWDLLLVHPIG